MSETSTTITNDNGEGNTGVIVTASEGRVSLLSYQGDKPTGTTRLDAQAVRELHAALGKAIACGGTLPVVASIILTEREDESLIATVVGDPTCRHQNILSHDNVTDLLLHVAATSNPDPKDSDKASTLRKIAAAL